MKLTINRLDYKNPSDINSYKFLPSLSNVNDIVDVNEVNGITVYFQTKDEAETFLSKFPKSYNGRLGKGIEYHVSFNFNTFWGNKTTGDKNETAIKTRVKVINKIKSLIIQKNVADFCI
jgi:ABC-type transport system substrate-binding protein